jgi:hypothetical protein
MKYEILSKEFKVPMLVLLDRDPDDFIIIKIYDRRDKSEIRTSNFEFSCCLGFLI